MDKERRWQDGGCGSPAIGRQAARGAGSQREGRAGRFACCVACDAAARRAAGSADAWSLMPLPAGSRHAGRNVMQSLCVFPFFFWWDEMRGGGHCECQWRALRATDRRDRWEAPAGGSGSGRPDEEWSGLCSATPALPSHSARSPEPRSELQY
jgi:hypothetical protein